MSISEYNRGVIQEFEYKLGRPDLADTFPPGFGVIYDYSTSQGNEILIYFDKWDGIRMVDLALLMSELSGRGNLVSGELFKRSYPFLESKVVIHCF